MISIFCEWPCFYLLNMTMPCLSIQSFHSIIPFCWKKTMQKFKWWFNPQLHILYYIYYISYIYNICSLLRTPQFSMRKILNFRFPCHRRASRDPSVASTTGFPTTGCRAERLDSPKRLGALEGLTRRGFALDLSILGTIC